MSRNQSFFALGVSLVAVTGLVMAGCNQSSTTSKLPATSIVEGTTKTSKSEQNKSAEEEHPHIAGAHGGIVIPIGSDSYHAEAVIEKDGQFRLLMLGADETRIQEVDVQSVKAYIKVAGDTDATPIDMKAVPQDGDAVEKHRNSLGVCLSRPSAKRSTSPFPICESEQNDSASDSPPQFSNTTAVCRLP